MKVLNRAATIVGTCIACLAVMPFASAESVTASSTSTTAVKLSVTGTFSSRLLTTSLANQLASPLNQLSGSTTNLTGTIGSQVDSSLNQLTSISSTSGLGLDPTLEAAGALTSNTTTAVALAVTFLASQPTEPTDPTDPTGPQTD